MLTIRYRVVFQAISAMDWIGVGVWAFAGLLFLAMGVTRHEWMLWAIGFEFLSLVLPIHVLTARQRAKRKQSVS